MNILTFRDVFEIIIKLSFDWNRTVSESLVNAIGNQLLKLTHCLIYWFYLTGALKTFPFIALINGVSSNWPLAFHNELFVFPAPNCRTSEYRIPSTVPHVACYVAYIHMCASISITAHLFSAAVRVCIYVCVRNYICVSNYIHFAWLSVCVCLYGPPCVCVCVCVGSGETNLKIQYNEIYLIV